MNIARAHTYIAVDPLPCSEISSVAFIGMICLKVRRDFEEIRYLCVNGAPTIAKVQSVPTMEENRTKSAFSSPLSSPMTGSLHFSTMFDC